MTNATAEQAKNYAEIGRLQLTQQANQSRMTSITNSWNKIIMQLSEKFLPIIDVVLGFIADNLSAILAVSVPLVTVFSKLTSNFKIVATVLKFLGLGGKAIPVLGEIIMAIQAIWFTIKRVVDIFNDIKQGNIGMAIIKGLTLMPYLVWKIILQPILELIGSIGDLIMKGIFGVKTNIYEAIIWPFVTAWNWLKKTFFGESPSELGLLIVKGLEAVQSMLINLLVSPFKMAWNLIKEIPFVGGLFKNLETTVANVVNPNVTVDRVGTTGNVGFGGTADINQNMPLFTEEMSNKLTKVIEAIDRLTLGIESGKLKATVNIDSQKVDAATGRSLEFKGVLV